MQHYILSNRVCHIIWLAYKSHWIDWWVHFTIFCTDWSRSSSSDLLSVLVSAAAGYWHFTQCSFNLQLFHQCAFPPMVTLIIYFNLLVFSFWLLCHSSHYLKGLQSVTDEWSDCAFTCRLYSMFHCWFEIVPRLLCFWHVSDIVTSRLHLMTPRLVFIFDNNQAAINVRTVPRKFYLV